MIISHQCALIVKNSDQWVYRYMYMIYVCIHEHDVWIFVFILQSFPIIYMFVSAYDLVLFNIINLINIVKRPMTFSKHIPSLTKHQTLCNWYTWFQDHRILFSKIMYIYPKLTYTQVVTEDAR